ncbi:MAG: Lrp/AsnC family transcriptional regulator [Clostridiaceae bacterium]|jgi:DNA-binding Lrp family transcriptional regulator|nr:Lrp/AsnC family transcriptional regulator [Clostridiaceae bacterium]
MKNEIMDILSKNSRISNEQIAIMLGRTEEEVKQAISEMEEQNIILGYPATINWEKTDKEVIMAFIEVRVTPQRDRGFDKVAERIYQYPQVKSCNLMSGSYDLFVAVEGKTMKEVALFVAEKLATIESVVSTSTHFVLKKYKENGVSFEHKQSDNREAVVL